MEEKLTPWQKYKQNLGEARPWDLLDKKNYLEGGVPGERLSICRECPELLKATLQCKKCGCFMPAKVKLTASACPLGKWNSEL
jgi:hypothetical protein